MLQPQTFLQQFYKLLQTVEVPNSYWFLFEPTIYIIIYLPITIYHISNL